MPPHVEHDIDFVIPWVDDTDPAWLADRKHYAQLEGIKVYEAQRYRDWDIMRYWFRGVESFAPWVRTIHFVTYGHLPSWLNTDHPKLNIVKHSDYIPEQWLPTFQVNPIEVNIHRIKGLAEHFVYLNDDTFFLKEVQPTDFFKNGLPCATASLAPSRMIKGDWFAAPLNNVAIINAHFALRPSVLGNASKWFSPKVGKYALVTAAMLPYPAFYGFVEHHLPNSFLKSTFETVWEEEREILEETSSHRFRNRADVSQWLMENWQFASGTFVPRSYKFGKAFYLGGNSIARAQQLCSYITQRKGHVVCVNDGAMSNDVFEQVKADVQRAFESILPHPSAFEK